MKIFKTLSKRGLALFLVLTMCVSLLPATAMAAVWDEANHTCNKDGWLCTEAVVCAKPEHVHDGVTCVYAECQIPEHSHAEAGCVQNEDGSWPCGLEEHSHAGDAAVCTLEEHTHQDGVCQRPATHTAPSGAIVSFLNAVTAISAEVTTADEAAITAARSAYDALTPAEQGNYAVVVDYAILTAAEAALDAAKMAEAEDDAALMDDMGGTEPDSLETASLAEPVELNPAALVEMNGEEGPVSLYFLFACASQAGWYEEWLDPGTFLAELSLEAEDGKVETIGFDPYAMQDDVSTPVTLTETQVYYNGQPVNVYAGVKVEEIPEEQTPETMAVDHGTIELEVGGISQTLFTKNSYSKPSYSDYRWRFRETSGDNVSKESDYVTLSNKSWSSVTVTPQNKQGTVTLVFQTKKDGNWTTQEQWTINVTAATTNVTRVYVYIRLDAVDAYGNSSVAEATKKAKEYGWEVNEQSWVTIGYIEVPKEELGAASSYKGSYNGKAGYSALPATIQNALNSGNTAFRDLLKFYKDGSDVDVADYMRDGKVIDFTLVTWSGQGNNNNDMGLHTAGSADGYKDYENGQTTWHLDGTLFLGGTISYDWGTENVPPATAYTAAEGGSAVAIALPSGYGGKEGTAYTVDTTYYNGYTVYSHDASGHPTAKYVFSGWNPTSGTFTGNANTVIHGSWTRTPYYTVTGSIDNNGIVTNSTQYVESGTSSAEMVFTPAAGKRIRGVTENGTAVEFTPAADGTYTYPVRTVTGNINVVVTTEDATYDVVYNGNGATWGSDAEKTVTTNVNTLHTVGDVAAITRQGHVLIGWTRDTSAATATYDFDGDTPDTLPVLVNGTVSAADNFYAVWGKDSNGDHIADVYEAKVIYTVANGTWNDNTDKTDLTITKFYKMDDEKTTHTLVAADLPASTGNTPQYSTENFTWSKTPAEENFTTPVGQTVVAGRTYNFTKTHLPEQIDYYVVTRYYDAAGSIVETTGNTAVDKRTGDYGKPISELLPARYTEAKTRTADSKSYAYAGKEYKLDDATDFTGATLTQSTLYIYLNYGLDEMGRKPETPTNPTDPDNPDQPDNTPDMYQAKVTYKVENGTWSDDTATDKYEVLDFWTQDPTTKEWTEKTGAAVPKLTVPAGMKAGNDYDAATGAWDTTNCTGGEAPAASTLIAAGHSYSYLYTFQPKVNYTVKYFVVGLDAQGVETTPVEVTATTATPTWDESLTGEHAMVSGGKAAHNATVTAAATGTPTVIIPSELTKDNHHYVLRTEENYCVMVDRNATGDGANTIRVYYDIDDLTDESKIEEGDEHDDIPDKYQTTVTFKVAGGYWNAAEDATGAALTKADDITKVVTLLKNGVQAVDGEYALTEADIPAVGSNPDRPNGYKNGDASNWSNTGTTLVGEKVSKTKNTFTYTYPQKIELWLTATPYNEVYDGQHHIIGVTATTVGGETVDLTNVTVKYYTSPTCEDKDEINYTTDDAYKNVTTQGAKTVYARVVSDDYTSNTATSTVTITPRELTVAMDPATKVYDGGTAVPSSYKPNFQVTGTVLGETVGAALGADGSIAYLNEDAGTNKTIIATNVMLTGDPSVVSNYKFVDSAYQLTTQVTNTASTITPRPVTVKLNPVTKEYDGTTNVPADQVKLTLDGVLNVADGIAEDVTASAPGGVTYETKDVSRDKNGTVLKNKTITAKNIMLIGTAAANYTLVAGNTIPTNETPNPVNSLASVANTTSTITPKPLTVAATGVDRVYAENNLAVKVTIGDLTGVVTVSGKKDNVSVAGSGEVDGTVTSADVDSGKLVTIGTLTLAGTDAGNYTLTQPNPTVNIGGEVFYDANTEDTVTGMPKTDSNTDGKGYARGASIILSTDTPVRASYTFLGWSETVDGAVLTDAEKADLKMEGNGITLYAQWQENIAHVKFAVAQGEGTVKLNSDTTGTGSRETETQHIGTKTGGLYTQNGAVFTRIEGSNFSGATAVPADGYRFVGWYKHNTCTDITKVSDEANYTPGPNVYTVGTFYARFDPIDYTVQYDLNGGKAPENAAANLYADRTGVKWADTTNFISITAPVRDGYEFLGWYASKDAANTAKDNNGTDKLEGAQTYPVLAKGDPMVVSVKLWAGWKEAEPEIDGGVLKTSDKDAAYVQNGDIITYKVSFNPADSTDTSVKGMVKSFTIEDDKLTEKDTTNGTGLQSVKVGDTVLTVGTAGPNQYSFDARTKTFTLTTPTQDAIEVVYKYKVVAGVAEKPAAADVEKFSLDANQEYVKNAATVTLKGDNEDSNPKTGTDFVKYDVPNVSVAKAITEVNGETVATPPTMVKAGDIITWTITVTNSANVPALVTNLKDTLTVGGVKTTFDPNAGLSLTDAAEGESVNSFTVLAKDGTGDGVRTLTASYTVGNDDKGKVVQNHVQLGDNPADKEKSTSEVTVENPKFTVNKSVAILGDKEKAAVGDMLTYTITVENTGNVTLPSVVIKDEMLAKMTDKADAARTSFENVSAKIGEDTIADFAYNAETKEFSAITNLADDATAVITYTYKVTAADAGMKLSNTAVSASEGKPEKDPDPTEVTVDTLKISELKKELVVPSAAQMTFVKNVKVEGGKLVVIDNTKPVTLLYKITVTGDVGAKFTLTDNGATVVGDSSVELGEETQLTARTLEVLVTMEFTKNAAGEYVSTQTGSGALENKASVTPSDGTEKDPDKKPEDPKSKSYTVTVKYVDEKGKALYRYDSTITGALPYDRYEDYELILPENTDYDVSGQIPEKLSAVEDLQNSDKNTKNVEYVRTGLTVTPEVISDNDDPRAVNGTVGRATSDIVITVTYRKNIGEYFVEYYRGGQKIPAPDGAIPKGEATIGDTVNLLPAEIANKTVSKAFPWHITGDTVGEKTDTYTYDETRPASVKITADGANIISVYYLLDNNGDGGEPDKVPDEYQAFVKYESVYKDIGVDGIPTGTVETEPGKTKTVYGPFVIKAHDLRTFTEVEGKKVYELNDDGTAKLETTITADSMTAKQKIDATETSSGYAFDNWETAGKTIANAAELEEKKIESVTPGATYTYTASYDVDNLDDMGDKPTGGDGIPDKYQVLVLFESADTAKGTVTGKTTQVFTLVDIVDSKENYAISGSVTPAEVTVAPETGNKFTHWTRSINEDAAVELTGNEKPTDVMQDVQGNTVITFTAYFAPISYNVTVKYLLEGTETELLESKTVVTTYDGVTRQSSYDATELVKQKIVATLGGNEGKTFARVSKTKPKLTGTTEEDLVLNVYYAADELNDPDDKLTGGDGIPDKFQAVIEYKVAPDEQGRLLPDAANGRPVFEALEVVTLGSKENPAKSGKVTASKEAANIRGSGYAFAEWKTADEHVTYEEAFSREFTAEGNSTYTYTAIFMPDTKGGNNGGDEYPDAWQAFVEFKLADDSKGMGFVAATTQVKNFEKGQTSGSVTPDFGEVACAPVEPAKYQFDTKLQLKHCTIQL